MKILLINQTFHPDVVATSQQLTGFAEDLVLRGHAVSVLTGAHGYDDPHETYASYEKYRGVKIHRISYFSFGKKNKFTRFLDFTSFNLILFVRLLFFSKQDVVVGLTSPPLVSVLGNIFCKLKGGKFVYWVMDLNPDEAIAAGWLKEKSILGRILKSLSRWSFKNSDTIVALDPYMREKIETRYGVDPKKIQVIPPWAHETRVEPLDHAINPFRKAQGLNAQFVVMYSGNHSPCHPLTTLLEATLICRNDPQIVFYFIGGGSRVREVSDFKERHQLNNVVQLNYQPLEKLSESLSAADLHVTVMGNEFVGIVHPCKIYNILSVGRPFVFIGPSASSMGELVKNEGIGFQVEHGYVHGLINVIEKVKMLSDDEKNTLTQKSVSLKDRAFSRKKLSTELAEFLEKTDSLATR